jgi:hypothetical protein
MAVARARRSSPPMRVSAEFARDFRYVVWFYDMTEDEAEEWRALVRAAPAVMMDYIATLAMAHRCGYAQTAGNGYVRLNTWLVDTWRAPVTKYSEQGELP